MNERLRVRRRLLAGVVLWPAAAIAQPALRRARKRKEPAMSDDFEEESFSRIGPPEVPPVVFEGRRYEQIHNGESLGLDQRTGWLAVVDEAGGQRIAVIKVYAVEFDPDMEADVQDVFFTRLELRAAERCLLVENERGGRFIVDIDSREARPGPR
ncbi:hypothetical protein [Derxia gummosa]|uniref:Uncharacterized protein n=1 Tax=Derxia gummosa DSM 723 TaxID=1121388 RepID=A0A8B6X917_9BURK|nr:hypothetical protein [Derxia gummosa]